MAKMEKIYDISEIFDVNGNRLIDDFSFMDLRGIDLSNIDSSKWDNAIFFYTNFDQTGIKFNPSKLFRNANNQISIEGCSFEYCNLSYLNDFMMVGINTTNCNFRNTGLRIDFSKYNSQNENVNSLLGSYYSKNLKPYLHGVWLPEHYCFVDSHYFDDADIDLFFLERNPELVISSAKLYQLVIITTIKYLKMPVKIFYEYIKYLFLGILEFDKETDLIQLYLFLSNYFKTVEDELYFFVGKVRNINFENIDFTKFDKKLLSCINFENCTFNNCIGVELKDEKSAKL